MTIQRIETNKRLSQAVKAGNYIYISGQPAYASCGADVQTQVTEIVGRIDRLLAEFGADKTQMVSAVVLLKDIADFDAMNAVWEAWMPEGFAPSRACIESNFTSAPGYRVEIVATAYVAA